jgi:PucR-like helix-turn-helix protein
VEPVFSPSQPEGGVPLRRLVAALGADLTEFVIEKPDAPAVCDVVLYDAGLDDGIERNDLVLATGVGDGERDLLEVLARAAASGAAAVAVKRRLLTESALASASERSDVALLAVPTEANWAHVVRLVRNVLAAGWKGAATVSSSVGDLFTLADGLASMVGGNVLIEDPSLRVLAYSRSDQDVDRARRLAILQRRCPEEFLEVFQREGVLDAIRAGDDVVRVDPVPDIGLGGRLVCGVWADGELLGSLWVTFPGATVDAGVEAQLSAASRISALHLARHRAHELGIDIQRDRTLRDLLEGRASVDRVADTLGLDRTRDAAVISCALLGAGERNGHSVAQPLRDVLSRRCLAHRWQVLTSCHGSRVDAVFTGLDAHPHTDQHLLRLARSVAADAEKRRLRCVIAVGQVVAPAEINSSFTEASSVLEVLRRAPHKGPVARAGDVWAHLTLGAVLERATDDLAAHDKALRELAEHDRRHRTDYVLTLRIYLETMGDSTSAAQRLGIHPNTLRYRLRRLADFTSIDLADPVERMVMALQLYRL